MLAEHLRGEGRLAEVDLHAQELSSAEAQLALVEANARLQESEEVYRSLAGLARATTLPTLTDDPTSFKSGDIEVWLSGAEQDTFEPEKAQEEIEGPRALGSPSPRRRTTRASI